MANEESPQVASALDLMPLADAAMDFASRLLEILKQDGRLFSIDGAFLRNEALELGHKMDVDLLRLLLGNDATRRYFFADVDGTMVFDKQQFGWVVSNRKFLPDSFTRFRNTIGLVDAQGRSIAQGRDVELVWPFKDCVLAGGQSKEEEKREEVFYNETLAPDEVDRLLHPKVLASAKRTSADGTQSIDTFTDEDNLLVKGNNLLALASLLGRFRGKVNAIYIDPPFNTGRDDFRYNDRFTRSTWLTFMRTRLQMAFDLLSDDGNIFIHINDEQYPYITILANELFGEDNYVDTIIWSYGSASGGRAAGTKLVGIHDYILHFAKNRPNRAAYKLYTPYSDKYVKDWFKYRDEDGRPYQRRQRGRDEKGESVWERQYLDESKGVPGTTVWADIKQNYADPRAYKEDQKQHSEMTGYDTQKPEKLLKRILDHSTRPGDLVLDFFGGSGTTGVVAHKMGRRWIMVEQLEAGIQTEMKRLTDVVNGVATGISKDEDVEWKGGGSFVHCELKQLNDALVERVMEATTPEDLIAIWEEVRGTGFVRYHIHPDLFDLERFQALSFDKQQKIVIATLDKNQLFVNHCDIDDADYGISDEDKAFNASFYGVANDISSATVGLGDASPGIGASQG